MTYTREGIEPAPYQLVALTKILTNDLQAILIADGVGVGKTISAGYIVLYMNRFLGKPSLVVCSPSLLPKWLYELESKFGLRVFPIRSDEDLFTAKRETSLSTGGQPATYVMASSQLTRTKVKDYPRFSCVVLDEIHNYRNRTTKAHKQVWQVAQLADYRIGLSATPINNSLDDLVSELAILLGKTEWDSLQATVEEIWRDKRKNLTVPLVTRFTKDRLQIHFARRRIETRSVSYERSYMTRVQAAITSIHAQKDRPSSIYEDITYFRLAASSPPAFTKSLGIKPEDAATDHKFDALRDILSSEAVSQWLIYCGFENTVQYLAERIHDWDCFVLTGDTPMFDRPTLIENFKRTPHSLLIMTEVGSEGLDLQFCQGVINYDLHWNPMRMEQRIGRVDRVGQKKDEVVVYNIFVAGSIDERVIRVISKKLKIIEGSVFSPGTLFGEHRVSPSSSPNFFNDDVLSFELNESEALFGALKYNNELTTEDYGIINSVAREYCLPKNLSNIPKKDFLGLPWLEPEAETKHWLQQVNSGAKEFSRLFRYYS